MAKGLRLSEKWFNRGLWLVAFVFAWFLIGLGDTVIRDLPKVEKHYRLDDFTDQQAANPLRKEIKSLEKERREITDQIDQTQLKLDARRNDYHAARTTFNNWVSTRNVTDQSEQNGELVKRTQALDQLKTLEREALNNLEKLRQQQLDVNQGISKNERALSTLEKSATTKLRAAQKQQNLRTFLYRLALTLPLLLIAAWLFKKKRKTSYWPFVWGFIIFAGFAFFVELVPYLPSYGGYVRYLVGIILTIVIGRQAIISLNRYLEKQRQAEALPEAARRETMTYDTALARLAKNVCPVCERQVDLKDTANDFCPHCGIGLHDYCGNCNARKSTFVKFCHKCGTSA